MATIYPPYPPPLTEPQKTFLSGLVKEWAISHGLAVGAPPSYLDPEHDPQRALTATAPVTLFPSLFPLQCFHEALMLQTAFNELYANVERDEAWLGGVVEE